MRQCSRLTLEGAIYRVMNHRDRRRFLKTLHECSAKTDWRRMRRRASARGIEAPNRPESGEAKAERWVQGNLRQLGGTEPKLGRRRTSDTGWERIAQGLRQQATMMPAWTAQRPSMGAGAYVSNLLRNAKLTGGGDW